MGPKPPHEPHPTDPEAAIDTAGVARLLDLAPITLYQWRRHGAGPRFFRIGRSVRYRLGDVLAWRDARMVGSTK